MHQIERLPEMRREDAHLDIGTTVTIEGRRGRVVSLTAARVRSISIRRSRAARSGGKFKVVEGLGTRRAGARGGGAAGRLDLRIPYRGPREDHHPEGPRPDEFDINWMAAQATGHRPVSKPTSIPDITGVVEEYATPTPEEEGDPRGREVGRTARGQRVRPDRRLGDPRTEAEGIQGRAFRSEGGAGGVRRPGKLQTDGVGTNLDLLKGIPVPVSTMSMPPTGPSQLSWSSLSPVAYPRGRSDR